MNRMIQGYEQIIESLIGSGYNTPDDLENFEGTPLRAAKGLSEICRPLAKIKEDLVNIFSKSFPSPHDDMVIEKRIIAFGVCPHHLLPVIYRVTVAYVPLEKSKGGRVLGLSKLPRAAVLLAGRPVLQETFVAELADALYRTPDKDKEFPYALKTRGSAVFAEGLHMCMAIRGVRQHESTCITSATRGIFRTQPETRAEFMQIVTTYHNGSIF